MSASATSAVVTFRASAIEADGKRTRFHTSGGWFLDRLYRFFDELPKSYPDVNVEVLKRVPAPV